MASKKEGGSSSSSKKGAPSVASFLSKISTPKGQGGSSSPAKGLLGGITRDDLAAVGRLDAASGDGDALAMPPPTDPRARPAVSDDGLALSIELAESGEGGGGRRQARSAASHTVGVRGVFSDQGSGDVYAEGGSPRTKDVSHGGVFVETAHLLEVGDPVVLSFPTADGKRLVVNGRVRWVTPFGNVKDPTPGMGIEFVGLDKAKRDRLQRVLQTTPQTTPL